MYFLLDKTKPHRRNLSYGDKIKQRSPKSHGVVKVDTAESLINLLGTHLNIEVVQLEEQSPYIWPSCLKTGGIELQQQHKFWMQNQKWCDCCGYALPDCVFWIREGDNLMVFTDTKGNILRIDHQNTTYILKGETDEKE